MNIIFVSQNKLPHWYFKLDIIIFMIINPKVMWNIVSFYYYLGSSINYLLIFFDLEIEINFDGFLKKLAFKVFISILLKCIDSNLAIVFINQDNIQKGWTWHFDKFLKKFWSSSGLNYKKKGRFYDKKISNLNCKITD